MYIRIAPALCVLRALLVCLTMSAGMDTHPVECGVKTGLAAQQRSRTAVCNCFLVDVCAQVNRADGVCWRERDAVPLSNEHRLLDSVRREALV